MVDIVSKEVRSRMMSGIRSVDTRPELALRRRMHALGLRFRLHRKDLPGSPDLVFPRFRAAVFVHGCYWHRHPGCPNATTPSTRVTFWSEKFEANVRRDQRAETLLLSTGWRVAVIWECVLRRNPDAVAQELDEWLQSAPDEDSVRRLEIPPRGSA
ncbi:very short patch repair endonuclease [Rhodobacter capsulatus]|uniref:very short patch repair endonuclease n=1 Tax=Rhodobacter capsulatus TaxID=1061 RepID=UPI0003D2E5F6|nr:very short patch repair endonuclease [Rhodobacter capsulatus]ETD85197.1 DNA glycosylase [Rhodobacter capsulatus B6]